MARLHCSISVAVDIAADACHVCADLGFHRRSRRATLSLMVDSNLQGLISGSVDASQDESLAYLAGIRTAGVEGLLCNAVTGI